jgi:hypothetical protein
MNGQERFVLENNFIVPRLNTLYTDSFTRTNDCYSFFVTVTGDFVSLNGDIFPSFFPKVTNPICIHQPQGLFLFEPHDDRHTCHFVRDRGYVARFEIEGKLPIAFKEELWLRIQDSGLLVYDAMSKSESPLFPLTAPIKRLQVCSTFVDIILQPGTCYCCDMASPGWHFYDTRLAIGDGVLMWRRIARIDGSHSVATVTAHGELVLEKSKQKVSTKPDNFLSFEVIDSSGRPSVSGEFILVVTKTGAKVYEPNKLRLLKKRKFEVNAIDFTVTDSGTLIVQLPGKVDVFQLPDVSAEHLGTLSVGPETLCKVIPGCGVFVVDKDGPVVYSAAPDRDFLDGGAEELVEPPVVVKKMFGKPQIRRALSLEETDASFRFKRAQGMMSETVNIMQQLLVTAQERSEKLSEMEIKSDRLLATAKEFAARARRFRK